MHSETSDFVGFYSDGDTGGAGRERMNVIKEQQRINQAELNKQTADSASWHAQYADSAYVYIGGLDLRLSEGDVITIFSQYGEVVDVNLVRDKKTGKSMGFAFLAYEDQRSTTLAVDNISGFKLLGRTLKVDHKVGYKAPEEEAAEEEDAVGLGGMKGGKEEREKRKQIDIGETHSQAAAAARMYPHLQKVFSDKHGGTIDKMAGLDDGGTKLDPDEMWEKKFLARLGSDGEGGASSKESKEAKKERKAAKAERKVKKEAKRAKKEKKEAKKAKKEGKDGGGSEGPESEKKKGGSSKGRSSSSSSDSEDGAVKDRDHAPREGAASRDRRGGSRDRRGGSRDRRGGSRDRRSGSRDRRDDRSRDRRSRSPYRSRDRRSGSRDRRDDRSRDRRSRSPYRGGRGGRGGYGDRGRDRSRSGSRERGGAGGRGRSRSRERGRGEGGGRDR